LSIERAISDNYQHIGQYSALLSSHYRSNTEDPVQILLELNKRLCLPNRPDGLS